MRLLPQQGWISYGRHVLQYLPGRYEPGARPSELIVGVLLGHQSVSLLSFWFEVPEPAMGNQ